MFLGLVLDSRPIREELAKIRPFIIKDGRMEAEWRLIRFLRFDDQYLQRISIVIYIKVMHTGSENS